MDLILFKFRSSSSKCYEESLKAAQENIWRIKTLQKM